MERLSIVLLVALMLVGCSFADYNRDYKAPLEIATEQSEYIMECVVNKDKEGLKSVFSKYVSDTHDLDKEIDEFFEFIDGEIVSYDEPVGREGGASMAYGEYIEKELNGCTENIITDTKKKYVISFFMYQISKYDEDKEGVYIITISDIGDMENIEQRYIGNLEQRFVE